MLKGEFSSSSINSFLYNYNLIILVPFPRFQKRGNKRGKKGLKKVKKEFYSGTLMLLG